MKFPRDRTDRRGWLRRRRLRDADARQDPAHHAEIPPAHDQPWVPRSALADRVRRSPRNCAEEAPDAYKDVDEVVGTCVRAQLAGAVARLRPVSVIKA